MTPYLFARLSVALTGTPDVLDGLLGSVVLDDPLWDFRPDPERFSLREILAHLVDLEAVWFDHFSRTRDANLTSFDKFDSAQKVIDNNYAESNPIESLAKFRTERLKLTELIKTFSEDEWANQMVLPPPKGTLNIEAQAMFIAVHDGYHTGQAAQWIAISRSR
jgi:uncharacterized damage-inducible protein DinB